VSVSQAQYPPFNALLVMSHLRIYCYYSIIDMSTNLLVLHENGYQSPVVIHILASYGHSSLCHSPDTVYLLKYVDVMFGGVSL